MTGHCSTHSFCFSIFLFIFVEKIPPDFVQPLESVAVSEGELVTFEGKVKGSPKPEVRINLLVLIS